MELILASQSASRRAMLDAAGIAYAALPARVDEDAVKLALRAEGRSTRDLADALAELKAVKVSRQHPQALVLGCDSTVAAPDGTQLDKAETRDEAAAQLRALRGATHRLHSAAVLAQGGQPIWRVVESAKLTVRPFSDAWLETYLDAEWPAIRACVGGYRLEALGAQLFTRIEGSHFTVLGMPLLQVLDQLRVLGAIAA
ncbi:MAG: nucleoside triphosphate pyrophosphatase [Sphingomonas sp.]